MYIGPVLCSCTATRSLSNFGGWTKACCSQQPNMQPAATEQPLGPPQDSRIPAAKLYAVFKAPKYAKLLKRAPAFSSNTSNSLEQDMLRRCCAHLAALNEAIQRHSTTHPLSDLLTRLKVAENLATALSWLMRCPKQLAAKLLDQTAGANNLHRTAYLLCLQCLANMATAVLGLTDDMYCCSEQLTQPLVNTGKCCCHLSV